MEVPNKNKTPTPAAINTHDRWPLPVNRMLNSVQSDFSENPSNINAEENKASNLSKGFKASPLLLQRSGAGSDIGHSSGDHTLHTQRGSRSNASRKPAVSVQDQNTNLRSFLLNTLSEFESPAANSIRTTATTATSSDTFGQHRSENYRINNRIGRDMTNKSLQHSSDSDSDGGVTLAMQAVFLQRPGTARLSLRPIASRPNKEVQKQDKEVQGKFPGEYEPGHQKPKAKEPVRQSLRPQPPLSSHMAAVLQTPGSAKIMPTRRKSLVTTSSANSSYSVSTRSPEMTPGELEKSEDRIAKGLPGGKSVPVKTPHTLPSFISTSKSLGEDKMPHRFMDSDNDLYWNTPITEPVQPGKPQQKPISRSSRGSLQSPIYELPVPVPISERGGPNLSSLMPRGRFGQLKDGDIVGEEAPAIPKENKGRRMLEKMGYKEGMPLGISGEGELEPVKIEVRVGNRGLGLSVDDLEDKARKGQTMRAERKNSIHQELIARAAQTERVARVHRASLDAALYNHTSAFRQQQPNQVVLETNPASSGQQGEYVFPVAIQIEKYTIDTPLEIHKIRERVTEIIRDLNASNYLGAIESSYILSSSINSVVTLIRQSRFGFLVDAELAEIVKREYVGVIKEKEQSVLGW